MSIHINTEKIDQPKKINWALPFFTIWTAQAVSLLGSQLVGFALIWWLTKSTGSATVLATASLVGMLPQVLIGPLVGALVDRWNRRITMIVADSVIALATMGLALLFWAGWVQIWHIYLLMFIRSVAGGFHWPAMQASTTLMAPKEHLSRIQGLNSTLNGAMNIASAPLGALLLELLPMQGVLAIDVSTALLAILPLLFVAIPQPERKLALPDAKGKTSLWQDLRQGLVYVLGWKGLLLIGGMALVINFLLNPAFSLMPLLVKEHFNGQAFQLAWMQSASGAGFILGGLILSAWGGSRRRVYTSLAGLVGMGIGCLVIGLMPASGYWVAVAAMFWLGIVNPITNGPLLAVVQMTVEPEMQGRVFTLLGSVTTAMCPLGLIIAGPVADWLGVQSWFILGGVITMLMGVMAFFVPEIVRFEDGRPVKGVQNKTQPLPASAAAVRVD